MLSSVSKLADKAFIIGFLLPALIFDVAVGRRFGCPPGLDVVCRPLQTDNPFANLTYFALFVWIESVLLLALNIPIFRFYEGYYAVCNIFGLPERYQKYRLKKRRLDYERLKNDNNKKVETDRLKRRMLADFPYDESFILPTSFGNRVRAFEMYSHKLYGADAIPIWWRLLSVLSKGFKVEIEDERSRVNFFMNLSGLSWLFTILCVIPIARMYFAAHHWVSADSTPFVISALIGGMVAIAAYYRACAAIGPWGEAVMAAFDCYLPALASQMGYILPATPKERIAFWQDFSRMFLYRRTVKGPWKTTGIAKSPNGLGVDNVSIDDSAADDEDGDD